MGGTGGRYFPRRLSPAQLAQRIRQAEDKARDDAFETEVGRHLASLLVEFNERDAEGTQKVLRQIRSDFEKEIEGTVETLFGGSISKHTYVDGISDIDALIILNNSELADGSPDEAKSFLAACLRTRYNREAVHEGELAVTVDMQDRTIQLLPALREGEGIKISGSDGSVWSKINPREFTDALTAANRRLDGKLVPCIKLVKAIVSTLPENYRISGYHAESLAIDVFREYDGPATTKTMLRHFFQQASHLVAAPIRDSSGQSAYVDEYLGDANSLTRRNVADALDRIARKTRNADGSRSLERWQELFPE